MSELIWEGRPAERSPYHSVRNRALVILGLMILTTVMGVVATIVALRRPTAAELDLYEPPVGSAVAAQTINAFIYGREPALAITPVTDKEKLPWKTLSSGKLNAVITPHSVEVIPFSAADGTLPIEMHRFLVSSGAGVHVVAVPIAIQPDGSATPAGPPTFEPYLTTEQPVTVDLYARFPEATLSPQAQSQIRTWAQAYFGNNLQGLQEATGQAQKIFFGVPGVSVTDPEAIEILQTVSPENQPRYIARVLIPVKTGELIATQVMDLIVDETGEFPRVVAWGAAGSGVDLYVGEEFGITAN